MISKIIDKLKDQGALLILGLYLAATYAAQAERVTPELAFGAATILALLFLGFKAISERSKERLEARKLDNFRAIELEKLRAKAEKQMLPKPTHPAKDAPRGGPKSKDPK